MTLMPDIQLPAMASLRRITRGNRADRALAFALVLALGVIAACRLSRAYSARSSPRKVIVLGIDGMDPDLLEKYIKAGKMGNFAALAARGSFVRLGTSIPPQSPVAWSNLITGMDPGGHGIFDFIHRDPHTMVPYLSTSEVEPASHTLRLGNWVLPLWGGGATLLRHGKAFWQVLDQHRVPAVVFHMPANFPPAPSKAHTLAGMGTPDLLGTYGTFSFYTNDLFATPGPVSGGRVYAVEVRDQRVSAELYGPYNTLRKGEPQTAVKFTVWLDPVEPVAKIVLPDQELLLREGEWSDWVRVKFELMPFLSSVSGVCKFYLKQVHPQFELYVTPLNLDPSDPALPISTPNEFSRELSQQVGLFYTLGIAEDTKALSARILTDAEYLEQALSVLKEQVRAFSLELERFRTGMFFFYFSSLDQNAHMFWRAFDEHHPAYSPELAANYSQVLEKLYQEMDGVLGRTLVKLDANTTLLVVSDHGFAPFYRSFNLNTWLLENGYLARKKGASGEGEMLTQVDWSRTRAYGLGLNGLYLNLQGRERNGIVRPGAEAEALSQELTGKLLALHDPKTGLPPITRISKPAEVYRGPYMQQAPDLVIGYNRGYRAGWGTVLGGVPAAVLEDNTEAWSGDHCMDYALVPGVLLSNKQVRLAAPSLTDVAPTILAELGVQKPQEMIGGSVFEPASRTGR